MKNRNPSYPLLAPQGLCVVIIRFHRQKGMVLVEAVFAVAIIAITTLAFISAMVFTARQAEVNTQHLYGVNLAVKYASMIRASTPAYLGDQAAPSGAFARLFLTPQTVYSNPSEPSASTIYNVSFTFTGWGSVASATGNSLTASFPAGLSAWNTNEWTGHYVTITEGLGRTQIMRIQSNTANTLSLTADLTGATSTNWSLNPDSTSKFYIDDGKTARITITWGDGSRHQTINRTVFVARAN
jgi:type II secretory pathway pseudopilin PulG